METMLKDLKNGDLFRLKPDGPVWMRDEYDRSTKKYCVHKWDDVNHWSLKKGTIKVYVD